MIAFTIGSTKSYEEALSKEPIVNKIGKSEGYDGGWVWLTKEDAAAFISSPEFLQVDWGDGCPRNPANFSVYCISINNWEQDTYKSDKDNQYHLLIDARLSRCNEETI